MNMPPDWPTPPSTPRGPAPSAPRPPDTPAPGNASAATADDGVRDAPLGRGIVGDRRRDGEGAKVARRHTVNIRHLSSRQVHVETFVHKPVEDHSFTALVFGCSPGHGGRTALLFLKASVIVTAMPGS